MLTVACVEAGNYQGRGAEYVEKLAAMVARHLRQPYELVVQGAVKGLSGWWNKVALFAPGRFRGRVLYLDLDSVVVGELDALAETKGIIHLRDWGWSKAVYGSGVMVWDAGEHAEVWTRFSAGVANRLGGDQDWMTELGGWDALPAGVVRSYRYHCKAGPPAGCSVVAFHGTPKPHALEPGHWALKHWRL